MTRCCEMYRRESLWVKKGVDSDASTRLSLSFSEEKSHFLYDWLSRPHESHTIKSVIITLLFNLWDLCIKGPFVWRKSRLLRHAGAFVCTMKTIASEDEKYTCLNKIFGCALYERNVTKCSTYRAFRKNLTTFLCPPFLSEFLELSGVPCIFGKLRPCSRGLHSFFCK